MADFVGDHPWVTYPESGLDHRWSGEVWEVGSSLVRRGRPAVIEAELERHRWLADRFPMPVLEVATGEWLITTAGGHPAQRPERQPTPDDVPVAIGRGLRRLHELASDDCPYDGGWEATVGIVETAISDDQLDTALLSEPYRRYDPARLLELIITGQPAEADLVVCHGTPVLTNLLLDDGQLVAVTGVHRLGIADRHRDLAVLHRALHEAFGGEAVFGFYEGYGSDAELARLDHYMMLDVLLAAIDRRARR